MKKNFPAVILSLSLVAVLGLFIDKWSDNNRQEEVKEDASESTEPRYRFIEGALKRGETLYQVFKHYSLDIQELFAIKEAAASVHHLRGLEAQRPYRLAVDDQNRVLSFEYRIDDTWLLSIARAEDGYTARKVEIEYDRRVRHMGGVIRDNLVSSIGEGGENTRLALNLSDILAWDIDFSTDLRNGDTYKIVVEELYEGDTFKKYGNILAAEFVNNGETFHAYRFEGEGNGDYFDEDGRSLRKAFLKAPLSFRRISSGFSKGRYHPVLKKYRPHHGIDYAAPSGSPVSAVGDGTVVFSGYKGDYGKLVTVRHPNGYTTKYGHLSRIAKQAKNGSKVSQGQVIGYVGATGLATGPHLHYEMRMANKAVNPFKIKMPEGKSVPLSAMADFEAASARMESSLASIQPDPVVTARGSNSRKKGRPDGV